MLKETNGFGDNAVAVLKTNSMSDESFGIAGKYHVACYDADGALKWEEEFPNLVTAIGKQLMLDTLLVTASGYTRVGPYLGLMNSGGTPAYNDTMASHAGWTEFTSYTVGGSGVRGTAAFSASTSNAVASPNNVTTCAATVINYAITGSGTVGGCFLSTGTGASNAFSPGNTGTLYSAGNFGTAKAVTSGDTLAVTYSTTATG